MQANPLDPCPLAALAATTLHIERETAFAQPTPLSLGLRSKQRPYAVEELGIRRRIAPRRASDWTLVHHNDTTERLHSFKPTVRPNTVSLDTVPPPVEAPPHRASQDDIHQRRLARPRDTGHHVERAT